MERTLISELTLAKLKYVLIIGDYQNTSVTFISKKLQITKQSVSKMVSKLQSIDLIIKYKNSISLSEKGKKIYDNYKNRINEINSILEQKKIDNFNNDKSILLISNFFEEDLKLLFKNN